MRLRRCSRAGCQQSAVQTLTYAYSDSTAVLGPLATQAEPHTYDLCHRHASTLSAPRGWDVIRLEPTPREVDPSADDLLALANAVREVGLSWDAEAPSVSEPPSTAPEGLVPTGVVEVGRRGHLRLLTDAETHGSQGGNG